jgi:hypothetical protein
MEFQFSQFLLNLNVLFAARNGFSHPFRFWEWFLFGSNFDGVGVVGLEVDEVGERGRFHG